MKSCGAQIRFAAVRPAEDVRAELTTYRQLYRYSDKPIEPAVRQCKTAFWEGNFLYITLYFYHRDRGAFGRSGEETLTIRSHDATHAILQDNPTYIIAPEANGWLQKDCLLEISEVQYLNVYRNEGKTSSTSETLYAGFKESPSFSYHKKYNGTFTKGTGHRTGFSIREESGTDQRLKLSDLQTITRYVSV